MKMLCPIYQQKLTRLNFFNGQIDGEIRLKFNFKHSFADDLWIKLLPILACEMDEPDAHVGGEDLDLLQRVDSVLDSIPPVYKNEIFDSLKQVSSV